MQYYVNIPRKAVAVNFMFNMENNYTNLNNRYFLSECLRHKSFLYAKAQSDMGLVSQSVNLLLLYTESSAKNLSVKLVAKITTGCISFSQARLGSIMRLRSTMRLFIEVKRSMKPAAITGSKNPLYYIIKLV